MADMRIVKVVVEGELPESCEECPLYKDFDVCPVLMHVQNVPEYPGHSMVGLVRFKYERFAWCPLELEPEKEDEDV